MKMTEQVVDSIVPITWILKKVIFITEFGHVIKQHHFEFGQYYLLIQMSDVRDRYKYTNILTFWLNMLLIITHVESNVSHPHHGSHQKIFIYIITLDT